MSDALARSLASLTRRLAVRHESDAALLARYTSTSDPTAFAELVRRHGPLVLGVCRRMLGHVHDAEDAFQATFLVLARKAQSLRKPDALSAWLYGTALRVCRRALGKRSSSEPLPVQSVPIADEDPFAETAWKEVRGVLDEEMGRLPESLRAPLILCYFDGLTRDEAAEKLGCSRRTLMRRLEKGRERLRMRLEGRGVGTVGLGVAVLSSGELSAGVSDRMAAAAVAVGTGGPVSAGVQALASSAAAIKLIPLTVGLMLLLTGGGIGLTALAMRSAPNEQAVTESLQPAPNIDKQTPKSISSLDADGRPLPAGAIHRLGSRRFRIEGGCSFILPTPDGRHILIHPEPDLSAYAAQGLMLLDADTGLRVRSFEDSRRVPKGQTYDAVRPAAFSPDGKKLYALAWHKSEKDGNGFAQWASFANPSKRVVLVWDVATGKKIAEWDLPSGSVLGPRPGASLIGVNVSPDGKRLYLYGAIRMRINPDRFLRGLPGLHVLDAATGKKLQTWDGAGYPACTIADGKEVITFRQGAKITAHDAQTGKPVRTFALSEFISSVVLSADSKMIAAVGVSGHVDQPTGGEIKVWETATGREIRRLPVDAKSLRSALARLAFAPDGKTLYLGARTGRILRWDLSDGRALPDWPAQGGMIADLYFRPGKNELVSAGKYDGVIHRWDAATGKAPSTTNAYAGRIAVARSPDGKEMALADATGRLEVWDIARGRIARTFRLPAYGSRTLAFSPDGKSLLDAAGGKISVWDAVNGKPVREIPGSGGSMTFRADGKRLFASGEHGLPLRLMTWPDGATVWQSKDRDCSALSPDGKRIVSGGWNDKTYFLDPDTGAVRSELPGDSLASAAFSPDGRRLATTHLWGIWRVRDGITGAVLKEMPGFQHVWCVDFSPSGWLLAVAADNSVRVYDTASWQEVARFDGHDGTVRTVFFGHDDATLISASAEEGTALVWSLQPPASREPPNQEKLWADLAGDGPAVRRAVWAAAQHPDAAVKLFRQKWPVPEHPVSVERIRKLIGKLDSDTFAEREAAQEELMKLGRQAETELRKALAETTSPEVKRRAQKIVDVWSPPATAEYPADEARELRAVWALEIAGTAEARKLLEAWAMARVGKRLCEEAAVAGKRLQRNHR